MSRLWVKLTVAFLITALIAAGTVAWLSARATSTEFQQYLVRSGIASQPQWSEALVAYYRANGSWTGAESVLAELGPGMGRGRGAMAGAGPNLAVADTAGRIVASRTGQLIGEQLAPQVLAQGVPLQVDGRTAGTLLSIRPAEVVLDAPAQTFLERMRVSLFWAALVATALALVVGTLVSRRLVGPLTRLTAASRAIARGDLQQRVGLRGNDEVGELSAAFDQMAANLEQEQILRRNLVADVAHELRTPLTVIQGNLQAILDGVYPLDMEQIAALYDETHLLTRLVGDLRDLALAESGQLRLDSAPVDLAQLARTAIANFGPAAEASGVKLRLEAADAPAPVMGDADRLAQILRNLLSNALRHTPPGGTVAVSVQQEGQEIRLQVADTGSGIAAEDLPYVFERFYRADKSRDRRSGGAGLGLAIVRQLVNAHGGRVSASSEPGTGATFTVVLPVASPVSV